MTQDELPADPVTSASALAPGRLAALYARLPEGLRAHFALLATDRLTLFATLTAAVVLTFSRYHFSTGEYGRLFRAEYAPTGGLFAALARGLFGDGRATAFTAHATAPVAEYVYWFGGSLALFLIVPIVGAAVLPGIRIRDIGLGRGDWRYGLKAAGFLYLVMLPFVVLVSFTPAFANHYPLASSATTGFGPLTAFELSYWAYFIGWEFIYRGLLCTALYPRLGAPVILLHTIPFAVMHAGKPEAEAFGSILAGLALGVVAVRARSFWYGALLHAAVAFTMDVLAMTQTHRWPTTW